MSKRNQQQEIREWLSEKIRAGGRGTQASLADFIGIERNVINKILKPVKGKPHQKIKADELVKMAEFFGEAPPSLQKKPISPAHQALYKLVESLSPKGQENLLALAEFWLSQNPEGPLPALKKEKK